MTFGSIVQIHAWAAGTCVQFLLRQARQDAEVLHSVTNWRVAMPMTGIGEVPPYSGKTAE